MPIASAWVTVPFAICLFALTPLAVPETSAAAGFYDQWVNKLLMSIVAFQNMRQVIYRFKATTETKLHYGIGGIFSVDC